MQKSIGGRLVQAINIHLTLSFLGAVPTTRVEELRAIIASIHVARFRLDLNRCGCWRRNGVAWIAPAHVPAPLTMLVLELRKQLSNSGFPIDDKPFAPHVTLLRNAKCNNRAEQPATPFAWSVDGIVLVRSETQRTGPVYSKVLASPVA